MSRHLDILRAAAGAILTLVLNPLVRYVEGVRPSGSALS